MVDRRRIVDLWHQDSARVLVTLVRIEGSSYRRPGAHLLIGANGSEYAGTISGGCLVYCDDKKFRSKALRVASDRV